MTDSFTLSVYYKGKTLELPARLIHQGYIHHFRVMINNTAVLFEPDEEGSYRAIIKPGADNAIPEPVDRDLLQLVSERIVAIQQ